MSLRRTIDALLELTKVRITVTVTLSVATGYFLFAGVPSFAVLLPAIGTFLLACGSAALNQVEEARLDARMRRTQGRPIPSGRIPRDWALFVAFGLLGGGFYLLASVGTHTETLLALGALAVVWYNVVYVLLKRVTAFAVVPGSLIGAIPPVMGWVAAGGLATDRTIIWVAFFFFIWQIPHFWLLLVMHQKDYEAAGLPTLTRVFSGEQIARVTCVWTVAVAATGLLLVIVGRMSLPWNVGLVVASVWLGLGSLALLKRSSGLPAVLPTFLRINVYALLVMLFLVGNVFW